VAEGRVQAADARPVPSRQYRIVTVVSIGHGKDVSSEMLAPVVARRGQSLREITQRALRRKPR